MRAGTIAGRLIAPLACPQPSRCSTLASCTFGPRPPQCECSQPMHCLMQPPSKRSQAAGRADLLTVHAFPRISYVKIHQQLHDSAYARACVCVRALFTAALAKQDSALRSVLHSHVPGCVHDCAMHVSAFKAIPYTAHVLVHWRLLCSSVSDPSSSTTPPIFSLCVVSCWYVQ